MVTQNANGGGKVLVRACKLRKSYVQDGGFSRKRFLVPALADVDLEVFSGQTLAIAGESGSGKSTLAKCLAGLETLDSGEVWLESTKLTGPSSAEMAMARRQIQLVFQDSATALNPGFTAGEIVAEPLVIQGIGNRTTQLEGAREWMEQVGLPPESANRRPLEFSGGQRQRLAIARALATKPRLLILDEAFSGLDLLTQMQVIHLLRDLQSARGLTYLSISHDLNLVAQWADEICVMAAGTIVERGRAAQLLENPQHPVTQALLDSMLKTDAAASARQDQ